jgi:Rps23 Pro-64 3,4-dihydroxylase Tpa1-like proline 4-hydroxylase
MLRAMDRELLRKEFANATPYPYIKIERFLDPEAAKEIAAAYPSFDDARGKGTEFTTVNEQKKVQITDTKLFPTPISRLNDALASAEFLSDLSYITSMPGLVADNKLIGGGMHITGPGGRLDVHVDFNYVEDRKLHRRLNLLLYLNPDWNEHWGGRIQLWDKDVRRCEVDLSPVFNRCVIFETSDISYHGVTPVNPSAPAPRQSFATYYYTKEAPSHWTGIAHGTIFKARPEERLRGFVLMPAEKFRRKVGATMKVVKNGMKRLIRG